MSVSLREIRASPDALFEGFHLDFGDVRHFGFREALVSCGERLHPINRQILQSRGDLAQMPAGEFRENPEINGKIDDYIKANPKRWEYIQAMSPERMVRTIVLQDVQKQERTERIRSSVLKKLDENSELKKAYQTLVKNLREVLSTLDARLTLITPVNHEADSVEQLRLLSTRLNGACSYGVVKNHAHSEHFRIYDDSVTLARIVGELRGREITISRLHDGLVTALDENNTTSTAALTHPRFSLIDRQRLKHWQHAAQCPCPRKERQRGRQGGAL